MGLNSKIEWTDHTWNPWIGCTKVSEACEHCYAETATFTRFKRSQGTELWGPKGERHKTKTWKDPVNWNKRAIKENVRYKIFCASLADVMEDEPLNKWRETMNEWRKELFPLMEDTIFLDYLILTKRPENYLRLTPASWKDNWPRHVWAGTTIENQKWADIRIPQLLKVRSGIRFLSIEPMLGYVNLRAWIPDPDKKWICQGCSRYYGGRWAKETCPDCGAVGYWTEHGGHTKSKINWVICGGESGHKARPMEIEWVRDLRDQCKGAGIHFFMKQGSDANWQDFKDFESFPEDLKVREFPTT